MTIAMVAAGTFQYHSRQGRELMTPGSLMLGSAGQYFECGHEHAIGDRCISFSYSPEFFDRLEAGPAFRTLRVPPIRALSPIRARVSAALHGVDHTSWEELGVELAAQTIQLDRGQPSAPNNVSPAASARVTDIVRTIEKDLDGSNELNALALAARLSPYHFLRIFRDVTGMTPHQYILRLRLERAALRLRTESTNVIDIALECGFGDVSNFNRTFRAEFGVSPRAWRK